MWRPRSAVPSLRGVKRRSNPAFLLVPRWIASLALAMTVERQVHLRILAAQPALSSPSPRYAAPARFHAVIARSETTKQSSFLIAAKMDCFASARNDDLNHRKLECPPASWPGSAKRASRNVRAIHVLAFHARKDVDARHKAGHDGGTCFRRFRSWQ